MILITGASGQVGRRIAELLAEHGHSLRLLVRESNRSPKLSIGQVVQGDYTEPATLNAAFALSGFCIHRLWICQAERACPTSQKRH